MGSRKTWFGIATSVTAIDATVVTYYGGVVWRAFAVVIWSKLLMLLLATIWAITLLHVWIHACSQLRRVNRERQVVVSIPATDLAAELAGEMDV